MSELNFNGDYANGSIQMNTTNMVCVPSKEIYAEVDICLKADNDKGMNLCIGKVVGNWLSFKEKQKLGYEIEKRWNAYKTVSCIKCETWIGAKRYNYCPDCGCKIIRKDGK